MSVIGHFTHPAFFKQTTYLILCSINLLWYVKEAEMLEPQIPHEISQVNLLPGLTMRCCEDLKKQLILKVKFQKVEMAAGTF